MELVQKQVHVLNQQQLQNLELLQMSTIELEAYIQDLALSNPLIEPEELTAAPENTRDDELLGRLRWLEENDRQNHFYQHIDTEELDPLARVGTEGGLEETLLRFLSRQLYSMDLSEHDAQIVRYLAACLDDDGYLRPSLNELSCGSGFSYPELERGLAVLQSLEPAGVGASSLSQCLALQLERIQETGPALAIVREHLESLSRHHYRAIAAKLGISAEEVQAAEKIIKELEPRPGSIFQLPEQVLYILPDLFVEETESGFAAHTRRKGRPGFHISGYYRELLAQSEDKDVREYLSAKLHQAEGVLWAVSQRESTLLRCGQAIADHQAAFFRQGPGALVPLRMADLAQELGLHESTVSRAVKEKYLQCAHGVYPLSYFFSRPAAGGGNTALGGTSAQILLRGLIDGEDKARPLSDQKLSERMAALGCPISRRTAAKYRGEMNIPGIAGRRHRGSRS